MVSNTERIQINTPPTQRSFESAWELLSCYVSAYVIILLVSPLATVAAVQQKLQELDLLR